MNMNLGSTLVSKQPPLTTAEHDVDVRYWERVQRIPFNKQPPSQGPLGAKLGIYYLESPPRCP